MRRPPRPLAVVAALILIIGGTQLIGLWLTATRAASPETLLTSAPSLADSRAPTLGPPDADVVVYLFSDYACSNCRALHSALRRVLAEDSGVRIVYRDWPILGERSVRAARLALASVAQGRHANFDDALMRRGATLDEGALRVAAGSAGVDWNRLESDAARLAPTTTALLDDTDRRARLLGFAGTPVLVVGPYLVNGRVSLDSLRELVRKSRGEH